jgi:hypothetical protein
MNMKSTWVRVIAIVLAVAVGVTFTILCVAWMF